MEKYETAIILLSEILLSKNNQLYLKDIEIKNLKKKIEEIEIYLEDVDNVQ